MFKLRWIMPLLALATVLGVLKLWSFGRSSRARLYYDQAARRIEREEPDYELAQRELYRAIDLARADGDLDLVAEALMARAELARRFGQYRHAREDYQRLLAEFTPEDVGLLSKAATCALLEEEFELAMNHARRAIEVSPDNSQSWFELGDMHQLLGERMVEGLADVLEGHLATDDVARAIRIAALAAALPPDSGRHDAEVEELLVIVRGEAEREAVLAAIQLAGEHYAEARSAYVQSLEVSPNPIAVAGLMRLLRRAERNEDAAELGWFTFRTPGLYMHGVLLFHMVMALRDLERVPAAGSFLREAEREFETEIDVWSLDVEELDELCEVYYRLEMWQSLLDTSVRLADFSEFRGVNKLPELAFYKAMAHIGLGEPEEAGTYLWSVNPGPHPFEEAYRVSLLERLKRARDAEDAAGIHQTLANLLYHGATIEAGVPHATEVGEACLDYARLQRKRGEIHSAEDAFAHGMRLLPRRWRELMDEWEEFGRAAADAFGRTIEGLVASFDPDARPMNSHGFAAFEYYSVAKGHFTDRKVCQRALRILAQSHPDLPPALELAGRMHAEAHEPAEAAAAWVRLGELEGTSPALMADLAALPDEAFVGDLRFRALLLDPDAQTLPGMVREMARTGQIELALRTLEERGLATLGVELRALALELYAGRGRWVDAHRVLSEGPGVDTVRREAPGLALQAALWGSSDRDLALEALVEVFDPELAVDDEHVLAALDALLAESEPRIVIALAEGLDAVRPDEATLLRLAAARLMVGEHIAAGAALDRAAAFLDLEPGIGRLLIAADSEDWDEVAREARELVRSPFGEHPYRRGLLWALQGEARTAHELLANLDVGVELEPRRRLAALLCARLSPPALVVGDDLGASPAEEAQAAAREDPTGPAALAFHEHPAAPGARTFVAMLLALEATPFQSWVVERWRALPEALALHPWAVYLQALAVDALGDAPEAEALFTLLTEHRFQAAWYGRERLVEQRVGSDSPEFLAVQFGRLTIAGQEGIGFRDLVLFEVRALVRRRQVEAALLHLERALEVTPEDGVLELELARLLVRAGERTAALERYRALLDRLPQQEAHDLVGETLELLELLADAAELPAGAWYAEVEALESQFADHPSPVRELLEGAIASGDLGAVEFAWRRFERFRERTDSAPLESLAPGATERWFELLHRRDPERSLEIVRAELFAHPASPELWRLWARALAQEGRRRQSLTDLRYLLSLLPDAGMWRNAVRLMADLGEAPAQVRAVAVRAAELADRRVPELDFLPVLATYRRGDPLGPADLDALVALHEVSERFEDQADRALLARVTALAWLCSDEPNVGPRVNALLQEALELAPDALQRDVCRAYAAIAAGR